MVTLIQDTLSLWLEAERVLEQTPPTSPDHELVARVMHELRATYSRLTTARDWSQAELETCRGAIESARDLLLRVGAKRPPGPAPI